MDLLLDPSIWAALATLTALEVVLGIDNIIFISIVASKLPEAQQANARAVGLGLALAMRVVLLLMISWILGLTQVLFSIGDHPFTWRDLILVAGGLFLLAKGTWEIHETLEPDHDEGETRTTTTFRAAVIQIVILDVVFSIDSIITAVGMTHEIDEGARFYVMVTAVVIAMAVMFAAATPVSTFIQRHPTTKMLALSFLLLVGVSLISDGLGHHIPRGYLYFAIVFSALVEGLNLLAQRRRKAARDAARAAAIAPPAGTPTAGTPPA